MKIKLSTVTSIILCAVLVTVAVCIGAVRGWSAERREVLSALTIEGRMHTQLEYRAMDAANLAVVAARHLPADDEDLAALRSASSLMLSGTTETVDLLMADDVIADVALRFADALPKLPSVQSSTRDKAYVSMLTGSLSQKTGLSMQYAALVTDFNQRLTSNLTGKLAMLLGVSPLPHIDAE